MDKLKELILKEVKNTSSTIWTPIRIEGYSVKETDECLATLANQGLIEIFRPGDGDFKFKGQKQK